MPPTIRASSNAADLSSPVRHRAGCAVAQSEEAIDELAAVRMAGSIDGDRCMAVVATNKTSDTKLEIIRRFMGETSRPYPLHCPLPALSSPNADARM
jgi:hypothetical protein